MKTVIDIARMELQKMFYSPIAWFVLIVFAVQSAVLMMGMISQYVMMEGVGMHLKELTFRIFPMAFFPITQSKLFFYIPLITMGLLSREFSSGSIKLLYSSPISNRQIVLGKFISVMVFGLGMVLILLFIVFFAFFAIKDLDLPMVLTGILGLYLLLCAYAAIGLFMSSLTSYQVVAALGTIAVLYVLQMVGRMWQGIEFVRDITYWLSIQGRADSFIFGLISSEDFLYFILVSALFITFTILRLRGLREKSSRYVSFARYLGVFMIVGIIGSVSTIPFFKKYYDSTITKRNTLTENSQKVISKLHGKLKITSYVNVLDHFYLFGAPTNQKADIDKKFGNYSRFHPNMKFKYKYYYALPIEKDALASHNKRYPGMTMMEAVEKACDAYDANIKRFKPATDYLNEIDLKSELNRFVCKIETEDGKSVHLRMFDDMIRIPTEAEITAALKKLVEEKLPMVGFVTGHEERDINDPGSRSYFTLTRDITYRNALINNGFDFTECELSGPVDKDIDILLIAESKTAFSEEEMKNLNDYIDRGGNIFIIADKKRQDSMNPLVERFGVKFMEGQVVEYNEGYPYPMDLITAVSTKKGKELSYRFENMRGKIAVLMHGAVGISYEDKGEFEYIPVLVSDTVKNIAQLDSLGSWNELKTRDFIDDVAKYNPEDGEALGPVTLALALTRKVGEKDQKIMILGDADCFTVNGLFEKMQGFRNQNFNMAMGTFFWMSDGEVPIDIRRPPLTDDKLYVKKDDMSFIAPLYKIVIPVLLALGFLLIWLRRKGR